MRDVIHHSFNKYVFSKYYIPYMILDLRDTKVLLCVTTAMKRINKNKFTFILPLYKRGFFFLYIFRRKLHITNTVRIKYLIPFYFFKETPKTVDMVRY